MPVSVVMRMSGHLTRNVFDRCDIVEDEDVRNAVKVIETGSDSTSTVWFGEGPESEGLRAHSEL